MSHLPYVLQGMTSPGGSRVVLVALMLALAGCSGVAGDAVDREPYSVDEPIEPEANPGIGTGGPGPGIGTDWQQVWQTHVSTLEAGSYERVVERTVTDENGTVVSHDTTRALVSANGTEHLEYVEREYEPREHEQVTSQWHDGERTLLKTQENESTETVTEDRFVTNPATEFPVHADSLFVSVESVTNYQLDDASGYVLSGSGVVSPYENTTFAVVLLEEGYIERLSLEGDLRETDRPLSVDLEVRIEYVDEPIPIDEPDWVSDVE